MKQQLTHLTSMMVAWHVGHSASPGQFLAPNSVSSGYEHQLALHSSSSTDLAPDLVPPPPPPANLIPVLDSQVARLSDPTPSVDLNVLSAKNAFVQWCSELLGQTSSADRAIGQKLDKIKGCVIAMKIFLLG